ncbi:hypothetical protein [Fischerella sp. JS2]|uniref:hypothetical protein n=1 Tax=Fischerella sp. JS2 TaxID=2597771 RepID=UPI0028E7BF37|nr:hypothetical protein [Fischerella sp. JS2]
MIAFYLKQQQEVEAYLQQRRQRLQEIQAMNQARFDPQGLRDRLFARRAEQEAVKRGRWRVKFSISRGKRSNLAVRLLSLFPSECILC